MLQSTQMLKQYGDMEVFFILCGQEMVKKIKIHCETCRYLRKRTIDDEMSSFLSYNITIAQ